MKKAGLATLMGHVTVGELKGLIARRRRIEELENKKRTIEKDLADVNKQDGCAGESGAEVGRQG